jgi:26S proteasome regulatory subunit N7
MAENFGVTTTWLDAELFRWITAGRLDCLMDKMSGTIRLDHRTANRAKNALYGDMIKSGDFLLNRLQKLGRIVNI